jgi:23S rRNA pseudouridine2605 synthase
VGTDVRWLPRRLDKFVRDASRLSLSGIRRAWSEGRIRVTPADSTGTPARVRGLNHLIHEGDAVELDGELLTLRVRHYNAKLNKPKGVTSTAKNSLGQADLGPWLAQMPAGTFAMGRLDRDTTGLLLFTTDGDLADVVLQPRVHLDKKYWLWLNDELTPDDPRLSSMVQSNEAFDCAKRVEILHQTPEYTELELTLDEGKNRQIRRLCRALGLDLLHLHRNAVGPITLGGLPLGELRALTEAEVAALWASVGGPERIREAQILALSRHARAARARGEPDVRLETWLERNAATLVADHLLAECEAR